jgi:hypothetical protein
MKIVVFDLDETLGYFTQFGIFWDSLLNYIIIKNKLLPTHLDFINSLDLFPEFLRPNIINILNYLKNKKHTNCCHKMMIYTNNTGPKEWAQNIISYFEKKINYKLIDQIIAAFKIRGKKIEICRTTQEKSYNDLVKCTKIPFDAEICFIDDNFYPEMTNENIYYINIKPYYHDLKFEDMLKRFINSEYGKKIIDDEIEFKNIMLENIHHLDYKVIEKNKKEYEIDKLLSKQILFHLQKFFNQSNKNKTIKNRSNKKNKTIKYR